MAGDPQAVFSPAFLVHPKRIRHMISVILALVPLLFATGFLTWTMTMGAREQARSDAWAQEWARKHHGTTTH
ncbi:MAG: hypothetical protein U1F25_02985 [Rubrivivax sp.]